MFISSLETMFKICACVFLSVLWINLVSPQEFEGDPCELEEAKGTHGVCTPFHLCDYADRIVKEQLFKPTVCSYDGNVRIVCCPNEEEIHRTGYLARNFVDTKEGILVSNDIECRYDGKLPLICCSKPRSTSVTFANRMNTKCLNTGKHEKACTACYDYSEPKLGSTCPIDTTIRIAGGENTSIEELPHMVVLGCKNSVIEESDVAWIGAGALISEKYVLTAGHVLYDPTYGQVKYALLGATNKTDIRSGIFANIVRIIPYKLYVLSSKAHDIALVELDYPVPFNQFIRPACLPVQGVADPDYKPKFLLVSGWGRIRQYGETSQTLLKADANIVSIDECKSHLATDGFKWDARTTLCARSPSADTCEGDSGGPLISSIDSDAICGYYIVGVVSWGGTCDLNKVAAYTRVEYTDYLDWINRVVWKNQI